MRHGIKSVVPLLGSAGQPGLIYRQNIWLASSVVGTVNGNANMVWLASGLQFSIVCSLFIRCHRMLWSISEFLRSVFVVEHFWILASVFVVEQFSILAKRFCCEANLNCCCPTALLMMPPRMCDMARAQARGKIHACLKYFECHDNCGGGCWYWYYSSCEFEKVH
jgi:hypothetical protein